MSNVQCALNTGIINILYIQIFNIFNAWFLHNFKANLIIAAIMMGFMAFRYESHPLFTVLCCFLHFAAIFTYSGTFQHGFSVAVGQKKARRGILAACRCIRKPAARQEILRALKSLRCVGIKVGEFHEIERNSPIILINYVETQVISLLLTFK